MQLVVSESESISTWEKLLDNSILIEYQLCFGVNFSSGMCGWLFSVNFSLLMAFSLHIMAKRIKKSNNN